MQYAYLSKTDIKVSQVCFGSEQLGGHEWGDYNIENAIEAANLAIEYGINFFDTADCYGQGQSEQNLGGLSNGRRSKFVIGTKFGVRIDANKKVRYDNSREYIEEALAGSLKRLKTDYIDLYQMHYWDGISNLEDVFSLLEKYVIQGKIRSYGVTNHDLTNFDVGSFPHLVSFSNEYSLVNRTQEETIKKTISEGLQFMSFGSLGQGILSGKYDSNSKFSKSDRRNSERYINFHGQKLQKNLKIVEAMRTIVSDYDNVSVAQLALKWILENIPDSVIISGIKNKGQLIQNMNIFSFEISEEDKHILDNISSTEGDEQ